MGIPATLRIRRLRSRSQVATIYTRCAVMRWTRQSSAYVPLCEQVMRLKRLSRATRKATAYFFGSFCNSAMTQSVTHTVVGAARQSSIPFMISILLATEKFMKFVSSSTRNGGPSAGLYWKNMDAGVATCASRSLSDTLPTTGACTCFERAFHCRRSSLGDISRFTAAYLRSLVFGARPMLRQSRVEPSGAGRCPNGYVY